MCSKVGDIHQTRMVERKCYVNTHICEVRDYSVKGRAMANGVMPFLCAIICRASHIFKACLPPPKVIDLSAAFECCLAPESNPSRSLHYDTHV